MWLGILATTEFSVCYATKRLKGYTMGQIIFGCDMIVMIKHDADWELIHEKNQKQINRYNIPVNRIRVD